ncbi:hypothetical protein BH11PSE13_BH11PSE13_21460 [soil metagenome]
MRSHLNPFLLPACLSMTLVACSSPPATPYIQMGDGRDSFGYSSEAIGDLLYRIDFFASAKTSTRTANAFALFRAAELANSLSMVAFAVESGPVDRSILDGTDTFSFNDAGQFRRESEAVSVVPLRRIRTASLSVPIYIETPEARDARTATKLVILRVRMHPSHIDLVDPRMFSTEDVLRRLGPRIVRGRAA